MAKKKNEVKPPKFTSAERAGNNVTFTWKKGQSDYTDINGKWKEYLTGEADDMHKIKDSKLKKNTTSKTISFSLKDYNPYKKTTLDSIRMYVQGEKGKHKSDWAKKYFDVQSPNVTNPSCGLTNIWNVKTFSWASYNADGKDDAHTAYITSDYYCATKVVGEGASDSSVKWTYFTLPSSTKSWSVGETIGVGTNSYTRRFAICARGPQGNSAWKYAQYVYAYPNKGVVTASNAVDLNGSYRIDVKYSVPTSATRPCEKINIEYAIEEPITSSYIDEDGSRKIVIEQPTSFSWQTGKEYAARSGSDSFIIGSPNLVDKCIYVRIATFHDGMPSATYGEPRMVSNGFGILSSPSDMSYSVNSSYLATITSINNTSNIAASYVAIYYRTNLEPNGKMVGVWPAGNTAPVIVQLPDPGKADEYSLGMRTFLSDYAPAIPKASGVTEYTTSNIRASSSGIIWDDRPVPKQPKINVTTVQEGTVRIEWDYKWTDANGMELSWANHEDAWESTDEPNTYIVTGTDATAWNITDLDYGSWWFRVRAYLTDGNSTTYGTPSDIFPLTLSSSPKPSLSVSPETTKTDGFISCYWAYAGSGDGDSQLKAEICEVTIDSEGNITPERILGSATDEQSITLSVSEMGWAEDSIHYISVRTVTAHSGAGNYLSIPKIIRVLPAVTASITSTSLVDKQIVIDGQTGETANVLSLTKMPLVVDAVGPSSDGYITYILERDSSFIGGRPDENDYTGFRGETVGIKRVSSTNLYQLSTDTSVIEEKAYYERSGSGTDSDPYVYTLVSPSGSENPSSMGWYELIGYSFGTTFDNLDLYLSFDDGARYTLSVTAEDSYGNVSDTSSRIDFQVNWDHQAAIPEAEIEIDSDNNVAIITPIAPKRYYLTTDTSIVEGTKYYALTSVTNPDIEEIDTYYEYDTVESSYFITEDSEIVDTKTYYTVSEVSNPSSSELNTYYVRYYAGDVCDIYRLSADKPELIISGATFGEKYVDLYPALGSFGGHRIVCRTTDGDFYARNGNPAWIDYGSDSGDILDTFATIIDFNNDTVILPYDLSLSTKWSKDFTETKYLGGSVQGDWNPAVSRSGSVKTRVAVQEDSDLIEQLRRLAMHAGLCHVRTPDGSSYAANVDVTEDREEKKINMIASFSLEITRVDTAGFEGITYSDWISESD